MKKLLIVCILIATLTNAQEIKINAIDRPAYDGYKSKAEKQFAAKNYNAALVNYDYAFRICGTCVNIKERMDSCRIYIGAVPAKANTSPATAQKRDHLLKKADSEGEDADSTYAVLEREFPTDSVVLMNKAVHYWRYGTASGNLRKLDEAVRLFTALDARYPENGNIKVYRASAEVKRCNELYYNDKMIKPADRVADKKTLIPRYEQCQQSIEKYLPKTTRESLAMVAKRDLETCKNTINKIKYE